MPGSSPTPPLGAVLVEAGVLTREQLASALRQQVIFGGRLGTNLLELGFASHDQIANALGRIHALPAALLRHIEGADNRARALIPDHRCVELEALPLAFATAGGRRLVVCMRDPDARDRVAALSLLAHMPVIAAACPERTLYRLLAHYCRAPLPARMSAPDTELATPFPASASGSIRALELEAPGAALAPEPGMPTLALVDLDDEAAQRDPSQVSSARLSLGELAATLRRKRASEMSRAEPPAAASPSAAVGPAMAPPADPVASLPRRRAASTLSEALLMAAADDRIEQVLSQPVPAGPPALDLAGALAQIEAAAARVDVSDAVIAYLKSRFDAGIILVVRDSVAYGYRGFGGHFDDQSVESILVPLDVTSPFQVAHRERARYVGAGGGDSRSLFGRFLRLFPIDRRPELCLVEPVEIRERVVCLIYAHTMTEATLDDDALDNVATVADAVGAAFLRLIKARRTDSD